MRTRNADNPKSGVAKGTPSAAKNSPATAEKTPKTGPKTTPKSAVKGAKAAGKRSASKAATPVTLAATETKPEPTVEESAASAAAAKSAAKKSGAKAKSPVGQKVSVEVPKTVEKVVEELVPVEEKEEDKEEMENVEEGLKDEEPNVDMIVHENDELDSNPVMNEEGEAAAGKQHIEEEAPEELQEPINVEFAGEEENVGLGGGETGEGVEEEEGPRVEDYEQMEISDMAQRRKMKKEQEIFVGGLDRDAVEEDIKTAFEKIGEVVEVRLHKDFITNKNKGFAFVKFANKEQAARAMVELKNPVIRGKRCGIAPSEDNDTLFLGNICNTWTKEAVKRKMQDYGINGVENVTLVPDTQHEGLSRGFAFLEFACHEDAMLAYKRLQKPDVVFGHPERTAKVAFAEPLREPDPEIMAQVKSVFVDGIPAHWDEDHIKEQLKGYGVIERVVLARNMSTAKRKDFGFVNFTTHEAAVACVEGVNNTELGDGKSKVKARARLANPLPKTQAVKGGMSGGFRIGHSGIGMYSRFGGRGFGRGGFFPYRAGFQAGRDFSTRGRGRGGRFFTSDNDYESFASEFHGRRPFGIRGGRGFSSSFRPGTYSRGRGHAFASRRPVYPPEEDFNRPFGARYLRDDPYLYGDVGRVHGMKRPFSMMDHDAGYLEPVSRLRPRYDNPDPVHRGPHYRGMDGMYSRDYYGSDYGDSSYSSMYGGGHSRGGYYY